MTPGLVHHRVSRSVAWRLAAGVLPSVLAVGLVIGLFYYGKFARVAPRGILILASALTTASIVIAWLNAAYFAERLARLARAAQGASGVGGPTDEFDRIEQAVGSLGSALTAAEAERARTDAVASARLREQATMLAGAVSDSLSQLDEVRLPLQILLESPFGELNDNQEELLRDARAAADAIDARLRRLGQVADIDRDAFQVQRELVQVNDVVRSVVPLARAAAERRGARTETALEPGLPRVLADRARLAEALSLFVTDAADKAGPERALSISTARDSARAIIRISPVTPNAKASTTIAAATTPSGDDAVPPTTLTAVAPLALAGRLIAVQGGDVATDDQHLVIRIGST
jgi:signal transduction histidine kinase